MAKIVQKGMWIQISSLNETDKKNYIRSMVFAFLASLLLGVHLGHIGIFGQTPPVEPVVKEPFLLIARLLMIVFFSIGAYFYRQFYKTQDDFFKRYHNSMFAGGAYGFLVFGALLTILSPYFGYHPNFYEFFLAFSIGTGIGGYYFYRKYIAD